MAATLYAGIGIMALLVSGCASMQVNSYATRDLDVTQYRSYKWVSPDRLSTGDPRLDNNSFFQERLKADVDRTLAARGFEKQEVGTADLIVHYHASVSQQIDRDGLDQEWGSCRAEECRPVAFEAGTIVLDLVDARSNTLVWRGWATGSIEGVIDDQDWLEQRIDEAVARILERLPQSPLKDKRRPTGIVG